MIERKGYVKNVTLKWNISLLNGNRYYGKLLSNQNKRWVSHNFFLTFDTCSKLPFSDISKVDRSLNYKTFDGAFDKNLKT